MDKFEFLVFDGLNLDDHITMLSRKYPFIGNKKAIKKDGPFSLVLFIGTLLIISFNFCSTFGTEFISIVCYSATLGASCNFLLWIFQLIYQRSYSADYQ